MRIFIPTYNRDFIQTLDSLKWNDDILEKTWLVVYRSDAGRINYPRKLVLDMPTPSITEKRHQIGLYCQKNSPRDRRFATTKTGKNLKHVPTRLPQ